MRSSSAACPGFSSWRTQGAARRTSSSASSATVRCAGRSRLSSAAPGNNGGDGLVIARHLCVRGASPIVFLAGDAERVSGDARANFDAWRGIGGEVQWSPPGAPLSTLREALARGEIVVDALFGTGLDRPIEGWLADVVLAMNASSGPRFAVDLPSGLDADTGAALGVAVEAKVTATFGHYKLGLLTPSGASLAGRVHVVDIGVPRRRSSRTWEGRRSDWSPRTSSSLSSGAAPWCPQDVRGARGRRGRIGGQDRRAPARRARGLARGRRCRHDCHLAGRGDCDRVARARGDDGADRSVGDRREPRRDPRAARTRWSSGRASGSATTRASPSSTCSRPGRARRRRCGRADDVCRTAQRPPGREERRPHAPPGRAGAPARKDGRSGRGRSVPRGARARGRDRARWSCSRGRTRSSRPPIRAWRSARWRARCSPRPGRGTSSRDHRRAGLRAAGFDAACAGVHAPRAGRRGLVARPWRTRIAGMLASEIADSLVSRMRRRGQRPRGSGGGPRGVGRASIVG